MGSRTGDTAQILIEYEDVSSADELTFLYALSAVEIASRLPAFGMVASSRRTREYEAAFALLQAFYADEIA
jgi:hypothetical protein